MKSLAGCSVVIPAAGIGARMGSAIPKQYLTIGGQPVLALTIERFLALAPAEIILAVSAADQTWQSVPATRHCKVVTGGETRADSVLRGLDAVSAASEWVLVHDAARPCVREPDVLALATAVTASGNGGILAAPVVETVKRVQAGHIEQTLDREQIWLAQTPQMFRAEELKDAIQAGLARGLALTDEASAMEAAGHHPLIVPGSASNLKITSPADLALAEYYLSQEAADANRNRL
ncbi:MAG: 2-C-methyl-D-erythritol 4-phosphate cytidylyltransferase [Pseudomonadales bacterium]|nr:2-C-methyl-D-erythritol 4-phosphate cytidylyltransferase [Pseudomonadales bacterium]